MANVIYRYGPISPVNDYITIKGQPIHLGMKDGQVFVWSKLLCEVEEKDRYVKLVATGEPYVGDYIDTFIYPTNYVYHLVEIYDV